MGGGETPSPTPIAEEGDIQIFANPECTEYADGQSSTVYARVNEPWLSGDSWRVGNITENSIWALGPSEEYPDDTYQINLWVDLWSREYSEPFTEGQVVEVSIGEGGVFYPLDDPTVIFYRN